MNNIALGKYLPLDSVIHKLDPRAKICAMLLVMIAIFIPTGYIGYAVIGLLVLAVALSAKLKINFLWRAMKPMLFMLVFLLVINLMVVRSGTLLFTIIIIARLLFDINIITIIFILFIVICVNFMIIEGIIKKKFKNK